MESEDSPKVEPACGEECGQVTLCRTDPYVLAFGMPSVVFSPAGESLHDSWGSQVLGFHVYDNQPSELNELPNSKTEQVAVPCYPDHTLGCIFIHSRDQILRYNPSMHVGIIHRSSCMQVPAIIQT